MLRKELPFTPLLSLAIATLPSQGNGGTRHSWSLCGAWLFLSMGFCAYFSSHFELRMWHFPGRCLGSDRCLFAAGVVNPGQVGHTVLSSCCQNCRGLLPFETSCPCFPPSQSHDHCHPKPSSIIPNSLNLNHPIPSHLLPSETPIPSSCPVVPYHDAPIPS